MSVERRTMDETTRAWEGRRFSIDVLSGTSAGGEPIAREVVRHPGGVVILPILGDGRLVLIRNDRYAVGERLWELPAGTLEAGEALDRTAARELVEETGWAAGRLEAVGTFYTTPGFTDERLHVFVARDLRHVGQQLEPDESIEVELLRPADVLAMIDDGRIRDAKTIATVLMWQRRIDRGRAED